MAIHKIFYSRPTTTVPAQSGTWRTRGSRGLHCEVGSSTGWPSVPRHVHVTGGGDEGFERWWWVGGHGQGRVVGIYGSDVALIGVRKVSGHEALWELSEWCGEREVPAQVRRSSFCVLPQPFSLTSFFFYPKSVVSSFLQKHILTHSFNIPLASCLSSGALGRQILPLNKIKKERAPSTGPVPCETRVVKSLRTSNR